MPNGCYTIVSGITGIGDWHTLQYVHCPSHARFPRNFMILFSIFFLQLVSLLKSFSLKRRVEVPAAVVYFSFAGSAHLFRK
jgi:hypothetical protein